MDSPDVVLVINTSPDMVDLLSDALERAGFLVVSTYTHHIRNGDVNLEALVRTHRPRVVVYDLSPPYERNFHLLQNLRQTLLHDQQFVLTSVNAANVERLVGRDARVYEVVGHSEDLSDIVRAVREAARSRPTS